MPLTSKTYTNILKAGLQASYTALETKDNNTLYFCTDTGKLYKGSVDFTNSAIVAATKPSTPVVGKLYFLADTNTVEVYVGNAWKVVSYPTAASVGVDSDDLHVATAKAVYDAIADAIEDVASSSETIKSIATSATDEATLTITYGDDSTDDVTINGVVTTPTWNASTRVLSLPVSGGTSVEVNIGKDIFLDPDHEQKYNPLTGNIELYLNDGSSTSDPTMISIPADSLVSDYTGGTSNTATVTIGSDHAITATVKLNSSASNAITSDANGLMVDLSDYALAADLTSEIATVTALANAAQDTADDNTAAIAVLNGDDTTAGSVAYAVKNASIDINNSIDAVDAKADANAADILVLDSNMTALATAALGWGTF